MTLCIPLARGMAVVTTSTIMALRRLQEQGFWLCLVSYCGAQKELQVREQLEGLRSQRHSVFDQIRFVREHLGERGKANPCIQLKLDFLVEDRDDICKEALSKGIGVCPIRTARNDHSWHQQAVDNFPAAAEALILGEVLKPPK